jgi:hypothetical protein
LSVQERLALRRQQLLAQKQQQQKQARNLAAAVQVAHAGGVQRSAALMPASDHPLAAAVENSSRLLAAKIQVRLCLHAKLKELQGRCGCSNGHNLERLCSMAREVEGSRLFFCNSCAVALS